MPPRCHLYSGHLYFLPSESIQVAGGVSPDCWVAARAAVGARSRTIARAAAVEAVREPPVRVFIVVSSLSFANKQEKLAFCLCLWSC